jgi:hypothetical protein
MFCSAIAATCLPLARHVKQLNPKGGENLHERKKWVVGRNTVVQISEKQEVAP